MSPESIATNLIGINAPSYTPGPVGGSFYSLYWPTSSNLEVWEHNSGGVYQSTKVDVAGLDDVAGFGGSSGLNACSRNNAALFSVTEVGPMLVINTRAWYADLTGPPKLYLIDILAGTVTQRTLTVGSMTSCSGPFQKPGGNLTSDVYWLQSKLSGSLHTYELWKCSLDAAPSKVWEDIDRDLIALLQQRACASTFGVHAGYASYEWDGTFIAGGGTQNVFPHAPFAGNDGTHDYAAGYDAGTGGSDRKCYAGKFDSGGYDSFLTNTTVQGDQPSSWTCYNVSVNSAHDTACMYVWDTGVTPPRYKLYQPRLGTGNEGADTDAPWQQIGQNGGLTPHAVFINTYQYPWS